MKKFFLGIVVFITTAIICLVSAGAETYGDFEYAVLDDGTVEITDYTGTATELEIPFEIEGKKVTSIGYSAFYGCTFLESVTFPDGIIDIGVYAFYSCTSLASVTIPDSVTNISSLAFDSCTSLASIDVDKNNPYYTSINGVLFDKSKTTLVTYPAGKADIEYIIPDGVTSIETSAFNDCNALTLVTIPSSVTNIKENIFFKCESLTSIDVDKNNSYYKSVNGVLFKKKNDKTILIKYPAGKTDAIYTMPDNVTSIGSQAFYGCSSLTSVTISDSVTSIDLDAFSYCTSLKSITIPDGVTSIGAWAFCGCMSLTSITIPDSVTGIGNWAFDGCDNLVINCYENSVAHKHAVDNDIHYNFIIVTAPSNITGFSLGGRASNALRLNWNKNDSADGYIIEMYKDGKWTRVKKITSNATTTYRVTGLAAGTAYKFRMRAYVMDGSTALYSDYTSTLSARTNPANVTGLKIGGRASNALRLNWTKNASADGYIVEQYKSGKWVRIARIAGNATTTYRVAGLKASTEYKFRVKAYKMSGSTALYSGYTNLSAYTNPSAVSNLKITGKAGTALRLGWSKNTSADGYIIEMYSGGKWVRIAKITSNATLTYRKAGLKKGTTYKFRVRTYNMVGKTALYGGYVTVSGTTNK